VDRESVRSLVEEELQWENELYRAIARQLVANMTNRYDWEQIGEAVCLWYFYSSEMRPVIKKAGVFPAAIEYLIAQVHEKLEVTQSFLAQKYGVSESTISQRALQLFRFSAEFAFYTDMEGENNGIRPAVFTSKKEAAQNLLYDVRDEPSPAKRLQLVRKALDLYPDSADAYNILAETAAHSLEEAAAYYKQGILAGERDLGQAFFKENKGLFWLMIETRSYMRAKLGYAEACWYLGRTQEALTHYEEMLELNPSDNQGVRYLLLAVYIEIGEFRKAAQLYTRYKDDQTACFLYDRVLIEYGLNGKTTQLLSFMKDAKKQNRYVIDYLLGRQKIPDEVPEYIGFGDRSEAVDYAQTHFHLWKERPELLRLLATI
jgi:tetratricopeptide (TPR) repeat protein